MNAYLKTKGSENIPQDNTQEEKNLTINHAQLFKEMYAIDDKVQINADPKIPTLLSIGQGATTFTIDMKNSLSPTFSLPLTA